MGRHLHLAYPPNFHIHSVVDGLIAELPIPEHLTWISLDTLVFLAVSYLRVPSLQRDAATFDR